jgi:hypothetical protein
MQDFLQQSSKIVNMLTAGDEELQDLGITLGNQLLDEVGAERFYGIVYNEKAHIRAVVAYRLGRHMMELLKAGKIKLDGTPGPD